MSLDIARLVTDWHSRQTGKIDKGQGQYVRGVNAQVNRCGRDASISADFGLSLSANLISYLVEVKELLAWDVQKLSPLVGVGSFVGASVEVVIRAISVGGRRTVDQLQDERSSGYDA